METFKSLLVEMTRGHALTLKYSMNAKTFTSQFVKVLRNKSLILIVQSYLLLPLTRKKISKEAETSPPSAGEYVDILFGFQFVCKKEKSECRRDVFL